MLEQCMSTLGLDYHHVQVLAMKLECVPSRFETDPEGKQLAAAINAHLPPEVSAMPYLHTL